MCTETFAIIENLFASFLGVVAVNADSFLAIHLHLRYQELVTHNRVVAVVITVWRLSIFASFSTMWVPCNSIFNLFQALYSRKTTQKSDSGPASTTSSTD